jgi:hypothetical protein
MARCAARHQTSSANDRQQGLSAWPATNEQNDCAAEDDVSSSSKVLLQQMKPRAAQTAAETCSRHVHQHWSFFGKAN